VAVRGRVVNAARLVISVHDIAPASATQSRYWLTELDRRGVPASLLIIPGRWRSQRLSAHTAFAGYLRERAAGGDDLVQHGWNHAAGPDAAGWRASAERVLARGAGEFAALSHAAAELRLLAGRRILQDAGLETDGFTAPGWLHSSGTMTALCALGYRYTTDHMGLIDLRRNRRIIGPALSHRAGGAGERVAARLVEHAAPMMARFGCLVRIALHPDDLSRDELRSATLAAIDHCLALGVQTTTYRELLDAATLVADP
jgi:uncharacterized protein